MKTHPLLVKLERTMVLTAELRAAVNSVPVRLTSYDRGQEIVRQGDRPTKCIAVTEGLLATSKVSSGGERQHLALHIPGDMPDLLGLHLKVLDCDVLSLAESQVAFAEHSAIRSLCDKYPKIDAGLWKATLLDTQIARSWIINGYRPALSRVAHLLCEMMTRMKAMGLAEEGRCPFPVTQVNLGQATGLSVVHINRTLQTLRARKLATVADGNLTVRNWDALVDLADFNPDYLHLDEFEGAEGPSPLPAAQRLRG